MLKIRFIDGYWAKEESGMYWRVFKDKEGYFIGSHWFNGLTRKYPVKLDGNRKQYLFVMKRNDHLIVIVKQTCIMWTILVLIHELIHYGIWKLPIKECAIGRINTMYDSLTKYIYKPLYYLLGK